MKRMPSGNPTTIERAGARAANASDTPLLDAMIPRATGPEPSRKRTRSDVPPRRSRRRPPLGTGEVVVGILAALSDTGEPLVRCAVAHPDGLLPAKSTVPIDSEHLGRDVVLAFERGDVRRPIIMGVVWHPTPPFEARLDRERLILAADREIVLQCGEASITLTRSGKIVLRGTYLLSRSSGANRIKGGSVQIN